MRKTLYLATLAAATLTAAFASKRILPEDTSPFPSSNNILKISSDLYTKQITDNLYFTMERLSEGNYSHWIEFTKSEYKIAVNFSCNYMRKAQDGEEISSLETILSNLQGGIEDFRQVLRHYKYQPQDVPHDVWILYASNRSKIENEEIQNNTIEMYCTVSTSPTAPFTTHMGISRYLAFLEACKPYDRSISI